jgi:hypothetical protein
MVGYAEAIDAWLDADVSPLDAASGTASGGAITWAACSYDVDLLYDTTTHGFPVGVRAVLRADCRRLLYEWRACEILLRITSDRQTGRHELFGQVLLGGLPIAEAAVQVGSVEAESPALSAATTDHGGYFRLAALPSGAYGVRVAVPGAVLVIPPVSIN